MKKLEITLYDSNFPHQEYLTPFINSTKIVWVRDGVRRKFNVYTDNFIKSTSVRQDSIDVVQDGNVNICLLLEPYTNPPWTDIYHYIQTDFEKFDLVISHNLALLGDLMRNRPDKFKYSSKCITTTWLEPKHIGIHKKTKNISIPFSFKNFSEGHRLRHLIYEKYKDKGIIDFYGNGQEENNDDFRKGLVDYKYSICCENTLQNGFNSEKLNDCFLTGTIPIYWGNKNIQYPYKNDSIFFFSPDKEKVDFDFDESFKNLEIVLDYLIKNDPYDKLLESIQHNFYYTLENLQSENNLYNILKERYNGYLE